MLSAKKPKHRAARNVPKTTPPGIKLGKPAGHSIDSLIMAGWLTHVSYCLQPPMRLPKKEIQPCK